MKTTMDRAGRLVLPKELRERVGLSAGPVEVHVDGAALRVEAVESAELVERDGRLVVAAADATIDDDAVQALRDALQR